MKRAFLLAVLVLTLALTLFVGQPSRPAFAVWMLPDGELRVVRLTAAEYRDFAITRKGVGEIAGRPDASARFLMAADRWDDHWRYTSEVAADPVDGKSLVAGLVASAESNHARFYTRQIPNHHSVTFDTSNSGTASFASNITVAGTVTSNANSYIGASTALRVDFDTVASVTWKGTALTQRLNPSFSDAIAYYHDLAAPASGAGNLVIAFTGGGANTGISSGGFQSAYGVDQAAPRSATNTAIQTGGDSTAAVTCASAVGELVFSFVAISANDLVDTPDATWTLDWNTENSGHNINGVAAHKAGAATDTRSDTLNSNWAFAIFCVSLRAASAASPTKQLSLLGVGD